MNYDKQRSTVIITGSDGYLGGKIIKRILLTTELDILGLTIDLNLPEKMLEREGIEKNDRVQFMENEVFLNSETQIKDIHSAIHLAFSRRMQPAKDIASSIDFAASVFHRFVELKVDRVVNLSSQGVYGNVEEIRTEDTQPAPETQYTMAKYAAEVLFNNIMINVPHHTNLRLDPVAQSQNVLRGLCKSAKEGIIKLKVGRQVFSFIDAEDAANAVIAMIMANGKWDEVYNVGWNRKRYSLVEVAELVSVVIEQCGYKRPKIVCEKEDVSLWAGMDSSRFIKKTGWVPRIDLEQSLTNMI